MTFVKSLSSGMVEPKMEPGGPALEPGLFIGVPHSKVASFPAFRAAQCLELFRVTIESLTKAPISFLKIFCFILALEEPGRLTVVVK